MGICKIGLAVNRKFAGRDGQEREETLFVDVDVWGKQAESCNTYLRKGSPALVEGRLKLDEWDDRETGRKRSKIGVTAERVQFLGGRGGGGGGDSDYGGGGYGAQQQPMQQPMQQQPMQPMQQQPMQPMQQPMQQVPQQPFNPAPAAPAPPFPSQQQQARPPENPDAPGQGAIDDIPF